MAAPLELGDKGESGADDTKPTLCFVPSTPMISGPMVSLDQTECMLNPGAAEFRPAEDAQLESSDDSSATVSLSVTAPVFVPRMPTLCEDGFEETMASTDDSSLKTVMNDTSAMPRVAAAPFDAMPPSVMVDGMPPPILKGNNLSPTDIMATLMLPTFHQGQEQELQPLPPPWPQAHPAADTLPVEVSKLPLPPPPGTAVLRTHLQRMSRELDAAKRKAAEQEMLLAPQQEAQEAVISSQKIAISALRRLLEHGRMNTQVTGSWAEEGRAGGDRVG